MNKGLTGIGLEALDESEIGEIARNTGRNQDDAESTAATAKQAMALLNPMQAQTCLAILQKIADTKPSATAERLRRHSEHLRP